MSKTVKRVSETVKRVMRVMMVGLIAMLGAKAEAHYYVIGGIPKRCSHCVDGEFEKDHANHKPDDGHRDVAEFRLSTKRVDYVCPPTGLTKESTITNAKVEKVLVVLKQIVEGDATSQGIKIDGNSISLSPPVTFNLVAKFSDSLLKEEAVCPGPVPNQPVLPVDVLIRETALSIVSYSCGQTCQVFDGPFSSPSCTLASKWNLANTPPEGISYVCRR